MKGNHRIEGAGERWTDYRKDLTAYVLQNSMPEEKILIIGAGACDDLSLTSLLNASRQVFLLDCNREAMDAGISGVPDAYRRKIHILEADIAGLSEERVVAFLQACEAGEASLQAWYAEYIQYYQAENPLANEIEEILKQSGETAFDRIICIGVHSQIYMPLVLAIHEQKHTYPRSVRIMVQNILGDLNRHFAEVSIETLHHYSRKLYLGYEYASFLTEEEPMKQEAMERLYSEGSAGLHQMQLPRVEGAYQLEQAIGRACLEQRIKQKDYAYMLWPFSEEKSYLMVIFYIM